MRHRVMLLRLGLHAVIVIFLTVLTQLGGLAWVIAVALGRRWLSFPAAYALLFALAQVAAPLNGREALPCFGEPLRAQSVFYCAALRNFTTPEMADVADQAAREMASRYPGTVTLALDGNFPFWDGFPLIPHLSHDDGEKLDLAFYYRNDDAYLPGATRSPLGYFAFETLESDTCQSAGLTLRWDLRPLQPLWRDMTLDDERTAALIRTLLADARVSKLFVEPPLSRRLGLSHAKLRFQGCRAARHDDHIHLQL